MQSSLCLMRDIHYDLDYDPLCKHFATNSLHIVIRYSTYCCTVQVISKIINWKQSIK